MTAYRRLEADRILDAFFCADAGFSFREAYYVITGDKNCTGKLEDCDPVAMREALDTSSWSDVLGAAVHRRMVQEYGNGGRYAIWQKVVKVGGGVSDFRTQERVRYGGYGDLPTVNEGAPYLALQSPADEKASYSLSKRGGTESITLEMIKNDDVGAIRLIPKRLAEAAHRTLSKFVLDILRANPVIYDGLPLFDAGHANLGNAALSAVSLEAGRQAMKKQTEPGSGDRLGTEPRSVLVPFDLEETAHNLFVRGTNLDKTFGQSLDLEVVPVWYWADTNDWCLAADPALLPSIEVAFLDGQEEPEAFVQDMPTAGSMFSNDQVTFKIRHTYGGAVTDFRGLYKAVV